MGSVLHFADGPNIQQVTPEKPLPVSSPPLAVRIDDTGVYQYFGKALLSSSNASPAWQISRLTNANPQTLLWADGDADFDNVWDNRSALSYT